jgi:hypothetical protein
MNTLQQCCPRLISLLTVLSLALYSVLSVVAQNVIVTISVPSESAKCGAGIVAIHDDRMEEIGDGVFQVSLGDLYAEECRDILFETTLVYPTKKPPQSNASPIFYPHALVELSYIDTIRHRSIAPISFLAGIARPNSNEISWPNQYVAVQWLRVRTAKAIRQAEQLAKDGEIDQAKDGLTKWIEEFNKESFEIGSKDDPLIKQLLVDLTECLDLIKGKNYNAYVENELGVKMHSHFSQRCSEPMVAGKHNVYRTGQKSFKAQAFKRGSGSKKK